MHAFHGPGSDCILHFITQHTTDQLFHADSEPVDLSRYGCRVCRASRCIGPNHKRVLALAAGEESRGPRIFSDYVFHASRREHAADALN